MPGCAVLACSSSARLIANSAYLIEKQQVLFIGYQAVGTPGRILLDGLKEIRLFGQTYPVKVNIEKTDGFSSHADHDGLLAWLSDSRIPPRCVFITHGEE